MNDTQTATRTPRKFDIQDTALWRFKTRLQFTGWLQTAANSVIVLVLLVIAGIGWLVGAAPVVLVGIPLSLATVAALILIFDLATLKAGIRPKGRPGRPRDDLDAWDLMRSRRSCRSFLPINLTPEHHSKLMASVTEHSAPERLLGIGAVRFEYIAAPLTVWPVVGAHEFLVAIGPRKYDRDAVVDVGRSLQHVVLDATRLGIATCWIGPGADHASILSALGDRIDPERDHIICVCAVGYRSRLKPLIVRFMQGSQHRRRPLEQLFFSDPSCETPLDVDAHPFDAFGRTYEACQWSPSSFNGQTTRAVGVADAAGKVRVDFFAATPSRYYAAVALGIWLANWEYGAKAAGVTGTFGVVDAGARDAVGAPELPRYYTSWTSDAPVS